MDLNLNDDDLRECLDVYPSLKVRLEKAMQALKTTLGRPLQVALRNAAERPDQWDVPGLLQDAADNLDAYRETMATIARLSRLAWTSPETVREAFTEIHRLAKERSHS